MSEKKFEECLLQDATHVEINGKVYKLGSNEVHGFWDTNWSEQVGINIIIESHDKRTILDKRTIQQDLFPILGIKPLKEKKPEPIEFVGFTKYVSRTLSHIINVPLGTPPQTKFKCVEILEDEE